MGNKIDWTKTHRNTIKYLSREKKPINYRELFDNCAEFCPNDQYGDKTDSVEKYRQFYAEQQHSDNIFIPGGYISLKRWFPDKSQLRLIPPIPHKEILKGNCIISYETGYEQALRQQNMMDHFNDAKSVYRQERRRRAALVESHIKNYFASHYPDFYQRPSNDKKYNIPSIDDFGLRFLKYHILIDIKTWSSDDGSDKTGFIRNIKPRVIYLWGDWLDDDTVQIDGFESGSWLSQFDIPTNNLTKVKNLFLLETEILLVILNMAKENMDYLEIKKQLFSKGANP